LSRKASCQERYLRLDPTVAQSNCPPVRVILASPGMPVAKQHPKRSSARPWRLQSCNTSSCPGDWGVIRCRFHDMQTQPSSRDGCMASQRGHARGSTRRAPCAGHLLSRESHGLCNTASIPVLTRCGASSGGASGGASPDVGSGGMLFDGLPCSSMPASRATLEFSGKLARIARVEPYSTQSHTRRALACLP
jgi:hypothetical protein